MELYFDDFIGLDFNELREFINQGGKIKFENMEKEQEIKKEIGEAMKKIKEIDDDNKIMIAKGLVRYYSILNNMDYLIKNNDISFKKDKYGSYYIYNYLYNFVDTSKRSIVGVIKALANDEKLSPFYKDLMFTHLFSPEVLVSIERKELIRERKKIEKEIKLEELNKLLNGIKLEELIRERD